MKEKKTIINSIFLCLFEILIGILLLINPLRFTSLIIVSAGFILLVIGQVSIIKYFRLEAKEAALSQSLVKGLVALLAGGFCICKSGWFVATFPILTVVYGISILFTGLGKIQMTVDMLRAKLQKWFLAAISAVITIVCAVVILKSPFTSTTMLWMFTGITLIIESILDIITLILNGKDNSAATIAE